MRLSLPKFPPKIKLINPDGSATLQFADWIRRMSDTIEAHETEQDAQIEDLSRILRSLSAMSGATVAAEADGASAKATVTAHTRAYLDTTIAVDAGEVTGLAYGVLNFLYYDDPDDEGGAVTYLATTTQADALTSADNPGRHFVGSVTAPATSGDPPTTGNPSTGAGGVQVN